MEIEKRLLQDILVIKPDIIRDSVSSTLPCGSRDLCALGITAPLVQDNHSQSTVNVLRGLHYQIQHPQGKLIRVLSGRIYDVAVDLRRSSATFGQHAVLDLSAADSLLLWIPPGYAHGFLVLEGPADVVYSVTDYRYAEYERTLLWSDTELAIDWPESQRPLTLSEKDQQGTPFAHCEYYD
jgi:dTDP-4-dehydrorhamnose 3,5-epimerase